MENKMSAKVSFKLILLFGGILLLLCAMVLGSMMLSNQGNTPGGNGPGTDPEGNGGTTPPNLVGLQDPATAAKYKLVGVKGDDTLTVMDPEANSEIVLNIEHRNWTKPKWSPDGKLIAVLAKVNLESEEEALDVFIYDLAEAEWLQATNFGVTANGVTGFAWLDENQLVFTQGPSSSHWLHRYDYPNREVRKEFVVTGDLVEVQQGSQRFVLAEFDATNSFVIGYEIFGFNGQQVIEFDSASVGQNLQLQEVRLGRTEDELIFAVLAGNTRRYYLWDFNEPVFREINLNVDTLLNLAAEEEDTPVAETNDVLEGRAVLCSPNDKGLFVVEQVEGPTFNLRFLDLIQSGYVSRETLDVVAERAAGAYPQFLSRCSVGGMVLGVVELSESDQNETRWYLVNEETYKVKLLPAAANYQELQLKK